MSTTPKLPRTPAVADPTEESGIREQSRHRRQVEGVEELLSPSGPFHGKRCMPRDGVDDADGLSGSRGDLGANNARVEVPQTKVLVGENRFEGRFWAVTETVPASREGRR